MAIAHNPPTEPVCNRPLLRLIDGLSDQPVSYPPAALLEISARPTIVHNLADLHRFFDKIAKQTAISADDLCWIVEPYLSHTAAMLRYTDGVLDHFIACTSATHDAYPKELDPDDFLGIPDYLDWPLTVEIVGQVCSTPTQVFVASHEYVYPMIAPDNESAPYSEQIELLDSLGFITPDTVIDRCQIVYGTDQAVKGALEIEQAIQISQVPPLGTSLRSGDPGVWEMMLGLGEIPVAAKI